jgi:hypothetical protein
MADLDQRIRLLREIAEAKIRFQTIAKPWMAVLKTSIKAGENVDIPASSPPELSALGKLIRQLEDELLMIDPTADIDGVSQEYREMMLDRAERRQQPNQVRALDRGNDNSTDRKKAAEAWVERHPGRKKAHLYREAGVDKAEYYRWERYELPDGSAVDINIRRILPD